ncbi:MAG: flagellar hook-length control protein FliK [Desulfitobacteriia bacterium]|jgi:hypothetical protein
MEIINVLLPEISGKPNKENPGDSIEADGDSFFALMFQTLWTNTPIKAEEQVLETPLLDDQALLGDQALKDGVFQNSTPTGKEADIGLNKNYSLGFQDFGPAIVSAEKEALLFKLQPPQGNYEQAFEPEGITGLTADSFEEQELENNRSLRILWKELSATVENGKQQGTENRLQETVIKEARLFQAEEAVPNEDPENKVLRSKVETGQEDLPTKIDFRVPKDPSSSQVQFADSRAENIQEGPRVVENTRPMSLENTRPMSLENTRPLSLETAQIWDQVTDFLAKKITNSQNVKELSIQLEPAELGRIKVFFRLEDGLLHLVLRATEQSTGTILQNNLQELRLSLSQVGFTCGDLEMRGEQNQEQYSEREYYQGEQTPRVNEEKGEQYFVDSTAFYSSPTPAGHKINVRA